MKTSWWRSTFRMMAILIPVAFGGCGGDDSGGNSGSSISIRVDPTALAKVMTDTLVVDTAKVLIKSIKFENSVLEDSLEFRVGPFVVILDLSGGVTPITTGGLPNGTYDRMKFKIHKPEDDETPPDPEFKVGTSGDERFSVIIKGHFNGAPFVYRSTKSAEQEMTLDPALVVSDTLSDVNVTLIVNPSGWFLDELGNILNPTNPDNADQIDDNIKDSFKRAVEDNDHDGDDDHDDDGGGL